MQHHPPKTVFTSLAAPYQTPIIAEYKNNEWNNVGNLKQARLAHGAITSGSLTMVIGGNDYNNQPSVLIV